MKQSLTMNDGTLIAWIDATEQVRLLQESPPPHAVKYYHYAGTEVYPRVRHHYFTSELVINEETQRHTIIENVAMNDTELAAVRVARQLSGAIYTPAITTN